MCMCHPSIHPYRCRVYLDGGASKVMHVCFQSAIRSLLHMCSASDLGILVWPSESKDRATQLHISRWVPWRTYAEKHTCITFDAPPCEIVLAADKDELRDGTWHMEILTNGHTRMEWLYYSDFGRARYEKSCNTKRLKLYDQVITFKRHVFWNRCCTIAFTKEFHPDLAPILCALLAN